MTTPSDTPDGSLDEYDDSPDDDRCGAEYRDGSTCQNHPIEDADYCRMHGGASPGAPEDNQNAMTTGLRSDPASLLDHLTEHRPEVDE